MANMTINPTITFNGKEATEGILEKVYYKPSFTRIHTVYPGIIAKEQIAFLDRLSKVTKLDAGCGLGQTTKVLPMHEKFWEPVPMKVWIQACWSDFVNSFFVWGMKKGINRADLSETDLATYLMDVIPEAMLEDIWRIVWFGDTAVAAYDASPAGTLGSASEAANYNMVDGLWKYIFAGVAIGAGTWGHIPRYINTYNALGTEAAQLALAADYAVTVYKNLIKNADSRLRHAPNKVILTTDTLFQNFLDSKESKVLESSFKRQEQEFWEEIYRSCTIIPIESWDRHILADFDNTTTLYLPHRAVLTTIDQIAVGFDEMASATQFEAFLDKTTELYNIKGAYRMDTNIIENYMFSVSY